MACEYKREFYVLYTHQKTKKSKKWQDGFLRVSTQGTRTCLFDDKYSKLDTVYVKPEQVTVGEELESDHYLITIEDEKPTETNGSGNEPTNAIIQVEELSHQQQLQRQQQQQIFQPQKRMPLKRKRMGFTVPRQVPKKLATETAGLPESIPVPSITDHSSSLQSNNQRLHSADTLPRASLFSTPFGKGVENENFRTNLYNVSDAHGKMMPHTTSADTKMCLGMDIQSSGMNETSCNLLSKHNSDHLLGDPCTAKPEAEGSFAAAHVPGSPNEDPRVTGVPPCPGDYDTPNAYMDHGNRASRQRTDISASSVSLCGDKDSSHMMEMEDPCTGREEPGDLGTYKENVPHFYVADEIEHQAESQPHSKWQLAEDSEMSALQEITPNPNSDNLTNHFPTQAGKRSTSQILALLGKGKAKFKPPVKPSEPEPDERVAKRAACSTNHNQETHFLIIEPTATSLCCSHSSTQEFLDNRNVMALAGQGDASCTSPPAINPPNFEVVFDSDSLIHVGGDSRNAQVQEGMPVEEAECPNSRIHTERSSDVKEPNIAALAQRVLEVKRESDHLSYEKSVGQQSQGQNEESESTFRGNFKEEHGDKTQGYENLNDEKQDERNQDNRNFYERDVGDRMEADKSQNYRNQDNRNPDDRNQATCNLNDSGLDNHNLQIKIQEDNNQDYCNQENKRNDRIQSNWNKNDRKLLVGWRNQDDRIQENHEQDSDNKDNRNLGNGNQDIGIRDKRSPDDTSIPVEDQNLTTRNQEYNNADGRDQVITNQNNINIGVWNQDGMNVDDWNLNSISEDFRNPHCRHLHDENQDNSSQCCRNLVCSLKQCLKPDYRNPDYRNLNKENEIYETNQDSKNQDMRSQVNGNRDYESWDNTSQDVGNQDGTNLDDKNQDKKRDDMDDRNQNDRNQEDKHQVETNQDDDRKQDDAGQNERNQDKNWDDTSQNNRSHNDWNQDDKNQNDMSKCGTHQDDINQDDWNKDYRKEDDTNQDDRNQDDTNQDDRSQDDTNQDDRNQDDTNQDDRNQDDTSQNDRNRDDLNQDDKNQDDMSKSGTNQDDINQDDGNQDKNRDDTGQNDRSHNDWNQKDKNQDDMSKNGTNRYDINHDDGNQDERIQDDIIQDDRNQDDTSQNDRNHGDWNQKDKNQDDMSKNGTNQDDGNQDERIQNDTNQDDRNLGMNQDETNQDDVNQTDREQDEGNQDNTNQNERNQDDKNQGDKIKDDKNQGDQIKGDNNQVDGNHDGNGLELDKSETKDEKLAQNTRVPTETKTEETLCIICCAQLLSTQNTSMCAECAVQLCGFESSWTPGSQTSDAMESYDQSENLSSLGEPPHISLKSKMKKTEFKDEFCVAFSSGGRDDGFQSHCKDLSKDTADSRSKPGEGLSHDTSAFNVEDSGNDQVVPGYGVKGCEVVSEKSNYFPRDYLEATFAKDLKQQEMIVSSDCEQIMNASKTASREKDIEPLSNEPTLQNAAETNSSNCTYESMPYFSGPQRISDAKMRVISQDSPMPVSPKKMPLSKENHLEVIQDETSCYHKDSPLEDWFENEEPFTGEHTTDRAVPQIDALLPGIKIKNNDWRSPKINVLDKVQMSIEGDTYKAQEENNQSPRNRCAQNVNEDCGVAEQCVPVQLSELSGSSQNGCDARSDDVERLSRIALSSWPYPTHSSRNLVTGEASHELLLCSTSPILNLRTTEVSSRNAENQSSARCVDALHYVPTKWKGVARRYNNETVAQKVENVCYDLLSATVPQTDHTIVPNYPERMKDVATEGDACSGDCCEESCILQESPEVHQNCLKGSLIGRKRTRTDGKTASMGHTSNVDVHVRPMLSQKQGAGAFVVSKSTEYSPSQDTCTFEGISNAMGRQRDSSKANTFGIENQILGRKCTETSPTLLSKQRFPKERSFCGRNYDSWPSIQRGGIQQNIHESLHLASLWSEPTRSSQTQMVRDHRDGDSIDETNSGWIPTTPMQWKRHPPQVLDCKHQDIELNEGFSKCPDALDTVQNTLCSMHKARTSSERDVQGQLSQPLDNITYLGVPFLTQQTVDETEARPLPCMHEGMGILAGANYLPHPSQLKRSFLKAADMRTEREASRSHDKGTKRKKKDTYWTNPVSSGTVRRGPDTPTIFQASARRESQPSPAPQIRNQVPSWMRDEDTPKLEHDRCRYHHPLKKKQWNHFQHEESWHGQPWSVLDSQWPSHASQSELDKSLLAGIHTTCTPRLYPSRALTENDLSSALISAIDTNFGLRAHDYRETPTCSPQLWTSKDHRSPITGQSFSLSLSTEDYSSSVNGSPCNNRMTNSSVRESQGSLSTGNLFFQTPTLERGCPISDASNETSQVEDKMPYSDFTVFDQFPAKPLLQSTSVNSLNCHTSADSIGHRVLGSRFESGHGQAPLVGCFSPAPVPVVPSQFETLNLTPDANLQLQLAGMPHPQVSLFNNHSEQNFESVMEDMEHRPLTYLQSSGSIGETLFEHWQRKDSTASSEAPPSHRSYLSTCDSRVNQYLLPGVRRTYHSFTVSPEDTCTFKDPGYCFEEGMSTGELEPQFIPSSSTPFTPSHDPSSSSGSAINTFNHEYGEYQEGDSSQNSVMSQVLRGRHRGFQNPTMTVTGQSVLPSGRNICGELFFPSADDIRCVASLKRQVQIPTSFSSVALYKQVFTSALKEHLNVILFELSQRYHTAKDKADMQYLDSSMARPDGRIQASNSPVCDHGNPAKMVCVKKEGANKGRFFYACSAPRANQCKFFLWADQFKGNPSNTNGKSSGCNRPCLTDPTAATMYFKSHNVHLYYGCEFQRKANSYNALMPGAPAWVRKHKQQMLNNTKKKLFLKLSRKEASSAYGKDDIWVISKDLTFGPKSTFLARSVYHGPSSNNDVEIEPLSGYSTSNWTSACTVHALLACNASSELTCLANIQEHISPRSVPILPAILNSREAPSIGPSRAPAFKSPAQAQTNVRGLDCSAQDIENIATDMIKKFKLNPDQAAALKRVAGMFHQVTEGNVSPESVTLIHGVFGAGKSFLLAVTVLFLVKLFELSDASDAHYPDEASNQFPWKLLIASTTNVAVDRILLGLLELGFEDFIRVGSIKKIAKPVLPYSVHASDKKDNQEIQDLYEMLKTDLTPTEKHHVRRSIERQRLGRNRDLLGSVRVVGVTCAACTFPCLDKLKFPVILLDECSQMTEPSSLLPIARFQCEKLVLVGDPKQLDPTVQGSEAAHTAGLEQTLFDRLIHLGYEPILLRTQYRCHPQISAIANCLFYDQQLMDGVSAEDRPPLAPSLPTLCFYNVSSGKECCASDGSYYNDQEASFVIFLIETLVLLGVEPADIGVITLYKAQTVKINVLLQGSRLSAQNGLKAIQISTVDAFQGGEKGVIILSCVRTDFMGFADSDKRTNVALTRSKNHLFIVGNLRILSANSLWGRVIDKCKDADDGIQSSRAFVKQWKPRLEELLQEETSQGKKGPQTNKGRQKSTNRAKEPHEQETSKKTTSVLEDSLQVPAISSPSLSHQHETLNDRSPNFSPASEDEDSVQEAQLRKLHSTANSPHTGSPSYSPISEVEISQEDASINTSDESVNKDQRPCFDIGDFQDILE